MYQKKIDVLDNRKKELQSTLETQKTIPNNDKIKTRAEILDL